MYKHPFLMNSQSKQQWIALHCVCPICDKTVKKESIKKVDYLEVCPDCVDELTEVS